jgi:hypothetical protein
MMPLALHKSAIFEEAWRIGETYIIQLQTHSIVDFIIRKLDMVLVRSVPFLEDNFAIVRTRLRSNEFLQVSYHPLSGVSTHQTRGENDSLLTGI